MNVGLELQQTRERRGMTLEQIAQKTKISATLLRHLEANEIDRLPRAVFLRGFLRAYAREVGLDPEDTMRRYLEQFAPPPVMEVADASEAPERHQTRPAGDAAKLWGYRPSSTQWAAAAAVVAIFVVGYALIHFRSAVPAGAGPSPAAAALSAPASSGGGTTGRAETGTAGSQPAVATDRDMLHLQIQARGPCWLEATVDGTRAVYRLLQAGDQQSFAVRRSATLRVGDPASLAFSINGMPGRPLGQAGVPVTVTISPQHYREFLSR